MNNTDDTQQHSARQHWMAVLARADRAVLENYFETAGLPAHTVMKKPETGTVMVEGRAGGAGRRFNLGEATVTRCIVQVGETLGYAYALGHDRRKALLAAVADAMLQNDHAGDLQSVLIEPLATAQANGRTLASRKAAATKVDFFTLVRGDD